MASTYSTNLKIELIGTGEQSGVWGNSTNTNLAFAIEQAIVGQATANFAADADLTLTLTNTSALQVARAFVLNVTGTISATRNLIVPTINKPYLVQNNTTGGQSVQVKTSAGTGVTIPNGRETFVYADGTNVVAAIDFLPALSLSTDLAVVDGGTGASDAAGARTNLGAQATLVSGTNIKTVNSTTLLGSGDLPVQEVLVSGTNIKTVGGTSLLGSGDVPFGAGPITYTGTHDFTAGQVDVATFPFGSSGSKAASLDYVNNAAFSTVLPGQTGNGGKFLSTDGSVASWEAPLPTQTGNAGKVLTTNGLVTSWQEIPPPNQLPILALGII